MRVARNIHSTGLPRIRPAPPCTCTARSTIRNAASEAYSLHIGAWVRMSPPASFSAAVAYIMLRAASSSVAMSAIMWLTAWNMAIGLPNWVRVRA
ncbi:hypothetical protein D3C72_2283480 [compost metagenome]